ncbi:MAG: hypothetical protein VB070_08715 [Clostridiaceae bacterium]|nr:hypothetical protein [Clostridiaceae bacterium]
MERSIRPLQQNLKIDISVSGGNRADLYPLEVRDMNLAAADGEARIITYSPSLPPDFAGKIDATITATFPMAGISRILLSSDFSASTRLGLQYQSHLQTYAMGFEPYAIFLDSAGKNLCFIGVDHLEYASEIDADSAGPSAEATTAEACARIMIRRSIYPAAAEPNLTVKPLEEQIYIETTNDEPHEVIGRYFAWLGRKYSAGVNIPAWGDEVQWHSWYAFNSKIDESIIKEQAELAYHLGIRRIHIDYGWDADPDNPENTGNNQFNLSRFPNNRAMINQMHQRGQKVSLRWTPFMLHPGNQLGQKLLPMQIMPRPQNPYGSYFYPCPCCQETEDCLVEEAVRIVKEYDIDELWFDMMDDFPELYEPCSAGHVHRPGTPGENVIRILQSISTALKKIKPDIGLSYRRQEANPVTRQFMTHIWPHDRYHDYIGNLRECLLIRKMARGVWVHNVCMCWNKQERPEIVARHMLTMIFGGIPAISVDLAKQTPDNIAVIKTYINLYQENKHWLNTAERIILCPEDSVRAIRLDHEQECWILCTATAPGWIEIPEQTRFIRIFITSANRVGKLLQPISGRLNSSEWNGVVRDCTMNVVGSVKLEMVNRGIYVMAEGNPLFCIDLVRKPV